VASSQTVWAAGYVAYGTGAIIGNIAGVDASGNVRTWTLQVGPEYIVSDGSSLYFVASGVHQVQKFNPNTGTVTGIGPSVGAPGRLFFDGANLWVSDPVNNTVTKMSPGGISGGTFTVGRGPTGLISDGANIWVGNQTDGTLARLRASDGQVLQTITTGNSPYALAFDGSSIWVANLNNDSVTKVRASDGQILGTFPTGSRPCAVVFDGTHIWVANSGSNTVSRF
jgi:outer membrane lipoprotein-sorting protein